MEKRIVKNILIQKTPHYAFPMLCGALYLFFNLFLYSTLKFSPSGTIKFAGTVTIGKRFSIGVGKTISDGILTLTVKRRLIIPISAPRSS